MQCLPRVPIRSGAAIRIDSASSASYLGSMRWQLFSPDRSSRTSRWLERLLAGCLFAGVLLVCCSCSDKSELARLKSAAKNGDPEAQFQLGDYYYEGLGLAPDYQSAAAWFRRAAQQGHPVAQLALGKMLEEGRGMLPDEVEGARWIQKAAEQGYAPAQDELATMYSNGTGVLQDNAQALAWATKAAEQGFTDAQYHLGSMLSSNAPATNLANACFWLTLAADQGHLESEDLLNALEGKLTPQQQQEIKQRADLWQKQHGNTNALRN
jgi:TPR repeat protein